MASAGTANSEKRRLPDEAVKQSNIAKAGNMYYVYIIKSRKHSGKQYVGYTLNVEKRVKEHNAGKVPSTKRYRPWRIVVYVAFDNKDRAIKFEKYLKTASGRTFSAKRFLPSPHFITPFRKGGR